MTVYALVQLKMTDRAAYDRYQARFFEVFKKFSGRLLSADENPNVLEGTWNRDKIVLMSFPDESAFHAWPIRPTIATSRKIARPARTPWCFWQKNFRRSARAIEREPRISRAILTRLSSPRLPAIAEERRQRNERRWCVINRAPVVIRIGRPIDRAIALPLVAAWADIAGLPLLHRSRSRVSRS
jgi:uncharacterized protein (DUF1330 family)